MSMSDNDTKELDSYGVWVKHSSGDENLPEADVEAPVENTDDSLDLPDFDDSDFSDMFKDDSQFSADASDNFSDDLDSTLSADELANITSGDISFEETPEVKAESEEQTSESLDFNFDENITEENPFDGFAEEPAEETSDISVENTDNISTEEDISLPEPDFSEELNLDDFETEVSAEAPAEESTEEVSEPAFDEPVTEEVSEDSITEETFDLPTEDTVVEENSFEVEETSVDEPSAEESVSTDDFNFDEISIPDDSTPSEENTENSSEEEISLDDFMDGGFSDESVASGNNGFEEGKQPAASSTEEVSLDDFVDMSEFGMDSAEEQKEDEIVEEAPLNMDISFDESAESVETEENISVEEDIDDEPVENDEIETEEVSLNDFGDDFVESVAEATDSEIATEDVDLSDFGIDSDAEETPIVQDVEESKNNEKVVDYDLSVGNENTATAPIVNEIKTNDEPVEEIAEEIIDEPVAENKESTEAVSTSLLQQIVADLSGLKNEINQLKSNLAEIKAGEYHAAESAEEPSVEENETEVFDETTVSEPAEPEITETEVSVEDDFSDDSIGEINTETAGGFFDLDDTDETIALSGAELDNIFNSAEFSEVSVEAPSEESVEVPGDESEETPSEESIEETFVTEDEVSEDINNLPKEIPYEEENVETENLNTDDFNLDENDNALEESIASEIDTDSNVSFDFENENLEEPNFEEGIALDESEDSDLPDEISVPKSDDILVETNNSDFMDSVKDNTEVEQEIATEIEDEASEDTNDVIFDTVDSFLENEETPAVETSVSEEEVTEESSIPEEEVSQEPVSDEVIENNDFAEIDNLNNDLSDSNIDYLTTKEDIKEEEIAMPASNSEDNTANSDLKKDIKSVLLYMDQLLENLPEEKIIEFAKSDEFSTYKKLFSELGLS